MEPLSAGLLISPRLFKLFPISHSCCYAAQGAWCWCLPWGPALSWSLLRLCQLVSLSFAAIFSFLLPLSCHCSYHLQSLPDCSCFPLAVTCAATRCLSSYRLHSEQQHKRLSLFFLFFFSVSDLIRVTASQTWLLDCNSPPSTPSSSVDAFLTPRVALGKNALLWPSSGR